MAEVQLFGRAREKPPEQFTATVTLRALHFADLGPVLEQRHNRSNKTPEEWSQ